MTGLLIKKSLHEIERSKFNRFGNTLLRELLSCYPEHPKLKQISAVDLTDFLIENLFREFTLDHFNNSRIQKFSFSNEFQGELLSYEDSGFHEVNALHASIEFTRTNKGPLNFIVECRCEILKHTHAPEETDPEIHIIDIRKVSAHIGSVVFAEKLEAEIELA